MGNFSDKSYQDLKDQLAPDSSPIEWERPRLAWSKEVFNRHRHVFCSFYKNCMNYAAGLHWKGWSCNWCKHNPHRFKETNWREEKRKTKMIKKLRKRIIKDLPKTKLPPKKKLEEKTIKVLLRTLKDLEKKSRET